MKTKAIGSMLICIATTINPVSAKNLTKELASDTAQFSKKPVATCVSKTTNKGIDLLQSIGIHTQIAPKGAKIVAETDKTITREITLEQLNKILEDRGVKKVIPNPEHQKQLIFIEEPKKQSLFSKNNEFIIKRESAINDVTKISEFVGFTKDGKHTQIIETSQVENLPQLMRADTTVYIENPSKNIIYARKIMGQNNMGRQILKQLQESCKGKARISFSNDIIYGKFVGDNDFVEITKKEFEDALKQIPEFVDGKLESNFK